MYRIRFCRNNVSFKLITKSFYFSKCLWRVLCACRMAACRLSPDVTGFVAYRRRWRLLRRLVYVSDWTQAQHVLAAGGSYVGLRGGPAQVPRLGAWPTSDSREQQLYGHFVVVNADPGAMSTPLLKQSVDDRRRNSKTGPVFNCRMGNC